MTTQQGESAPIPERPFADADGVEWDPRGAIARGPLLLGIYKSSCASSKQMFPFLERLHQRYGGDRLTVLGVSQDSPNITRSFARRYGITFPLLVEGDDYPVSRAFAIMATPTVFLIDTDGRVAYTTMGFLKPALDGMGDAVADALGEVHEPLVSDMDADIPMFVPG